MGFIHLDLNPTEKTVPSTTTTTTTTTPTTSTATSRPGSRRQSVGLKLPAVTAAQVNASVLNKLKLGKAEQFIFVFSQVFYYILLGLNVEWHRLLWVYMKYYNV